MKYNVYCDESCHLERDRKKAMSLGAVWCPQEIVRETNRDIVEIKQAHGVPRDAEVKWTKISPANVDLYHDLLDYFFTTDDLCFRGLVVPDKGILRHEEFSQTHDDWYYKMYFTLLQNVLTRPDEFFIYIDVKDTNSGERARRLEDVCANSEYDFNHDHIRRVQPIRSDQVQIMQLVDILTGALVFTRNAAGREHISQAKLDVVKTVMDLSGLSLTRTTLVSDRKFNLLVWRPYGGSR